MSLPFPFVDDLIITAWITLAGAVVCSQVGQRMRAHPRLAMICFTVAFANISFYAVVLIAWLRRIS